MTLMLGAWTVGLILSLLALGVFISFRVFKFPDITTEGSITLGASVLAVALLRGYSPTVATVAAFLAGTCAGAATGVLHTRFGINGLLSGIIVMTALYSVNLRVMGQSNIPLLKSHTIVSDAEAVGVWLTGSPDAVTIFGWTIALRELFTLV